MYFQNRRFNLYKNMFGIMVKCGIDCLRNRLVEWSLNCLVTVVTHELVNKLFFHTDYVLVLGAV